MTLRRAPTSGRGVAHGLAVAIGIPPELAVPGGERAVAAMMALKQAREAGGGMLRGQHLQRAQQHIAALDPVRLGQLAQHLQAHVLALQGRGGDTRIAHVTPGEVVVPKRLQNPEFLTALQFLARAHGIDPAALRVGSGRNTINPRTGQMEFDDSDSDVDFGDFDPDAYDPGNFNVNDLSNYIIPTDESPQSGDSYFGQDLLSSDNFTPLGLLASPNDSLNQANDWNSPPGRNIQPMTPPPDARPGGPDEEFTVKPGQGGKPAPSEPYQPPLDQRRPWIETLPHATIPTRPPYDSYIYGTIPNPATVADQTAPIPNALPRPKWRQRI